MKPGATMSPLASIVRLAVAFASCRRTRCDRPDADVGAPRRGAGAVDDGSVADQHVVLGGGGGGEGREEDELERYGDAHAENLAENHVRATTSKRAVSPSASLEH